MLTEQDYRRQAQRISEDIATYQPAQTAAALVEQLAATGQPVLRGSVAAAQVGRAA